MGDGGGDVTLQQLKYMIAIVRCGSISEAAKQLFVSQPSLSAAVKEVEEEIGIEIFTRTAKGVALTNEGMEFLAYARQVVEQAELLEQRYSNRNRAKNLVSISTQHYAFAVQAFVALLEALNENEYTCTLRETRTHDIIEDVHQLRSEIGILYKSDFNRKVIGNLLKEKDLSFHPLFTAKPHVFVSTRHPLAAKSAIDIEDLDPFPCLMFDQGEQNSFYFAEELLSTRAFPKKIKVSDRATLFNLLIGLNGFTISSGVINEDLNGDQITAVRLRTEEEKVIGYVVNQRASLSPLANRYVDILKETIEGYGIPLIR